MMTLSIPFAPVTWKRLLEQADNLNRKTGQDIELGPERLILRSPNGTRYRIVVSDAGAVSAEAV